MTLTIHTNEAAVKTVLAANYDCNIKLNRFIRAAAVLMARMIECATRKGFTHTADELIEIETWLAAYFYTKADALHTSRSTADASGAFQRGQENEYKLGAVEMDGSGCLNALLKGQRAGAAWLGKVPSEQTDYVDRD